MLWIVNNLWLIPGLPLLAAGLIALLKQRQRALAASLAIGSLAASFVLSCVAFVPTLHGSHNEPFRAVFNFDWLPFGNTTLQLGLLLDPLTAIMLLMVTFVGLLIFIYSVGYMAHDENFTRFFCFLALFAAAMLGIIVANSLLLLFISWELVGLASYLLIGFWYHKPSAAAAAKKAFITTRVGDIGFFLGILWLYSKSGTLLFYDNGNGCLEQASLATLTSAVTFGGMAVSTVVALLIFCGAVGKSGQVPLHVWLPDAMEGPTPVSALIHAATMVAAGVFMVARVYPLMDADPAGAAGLSPALTVVTWVGAITALFGALTAVAQNDIKRILAYSTVSQLGYMMMGLGVGGVAVGMFHLLTHAFFKALLFLGAGSVIHGCHEEQDIRRMGGLKSWMPVTFITYAIGMMALCGVPLLFSGFWSKDEILHAASAWSVSKVPFYIGLFGAILTAFYMTRQVYYVFFGHSRLEAQGKGHAHDHGHAETPHESPAVMTVPLVILAIAAIVVGFFGTPAWPWLHSYLTGHPAKFDLSALGGSATLMLVSTVVVAIGIGSAWLLYSRKAPRTAAEPDPLEKAQPLLWGLLANKFYVDEIYEATVIRLNAFAAHLSDWFDRVIWNGLVQMIQLLTDGLARISRAMDHYVVNGTFDESCSGIRRNARWFSAWQNGRVQSYLRVVGAGMVLLVLLLLWGCRS
jgi:NADH-quinone oxidoreductase subunit L